MSELLPLWSKQHCGVYQATFHGMLALMPDLEPLMHTFPDHGTDFTWCVKVHMLMPGQYACIPGWHHDMVPRDANRVQDWSKVKPDLPMYLWVSGDPMTEFKNDPQPKPMQWHRFTQLDEHRGTMSDRHTWRCFIRACHQKILRPAHPDKWLRRHSQIYLNAEGFKW